MQLIRNACSAREVAAQPYFTLASLHFGVDMLRFSIVLLPIEVSCYWQNSGDVAGDVLMGCTFCMGCITHSQHCKCAHHQHIILSAVVYASTHACKHMLACRCQPRAPELKQQMFLQVNFRGSTGYGKTFLHAGDKQWGTGDMQNDLTDAVQWAVDQGIADANKVAIYGGSYGGLMQRLMHAVHQILPWQL